MSGTFNYRKQLLQAVDAFLEGTSAAQIRARNIIDTPIEWDGMSETLDMFIWPFFFKALKDSVYYENEDFLRDTREILLGQSSSNTIRMAQDINYRKHFTADEEQWYTQLQEIIDLITTIPFAKISEATAHAHHDIKRWKTTFESMPEAVQVKEIQEAYLQKQALLKQSVLRYPSPAYIGDEYIHRLVLREITSLLSNINIFTEAIYCGYPVPGGQQTITSGFPLGHSPDMTESLLWAKRTLNALAGQGTFFISWRLSTSLTEQIDTLLISFH